MSHFAVEQTLRKAKRHASLGEVAEARQLFQSVLERFPNNTRAKNGIAGLRAQGALGNSVGETDRLARMQAENHLVDLYHAGRLQDLSRRLPKALERYPKSATLWNVAGALSIGLKAWEKARNAFAQVVSLQPGEAHGYNNLGLALKELGETEEAVRNFEKALELSPGYADALNNLGRAYLQAGDAEKARDMIAEAVELQPDHVQALNNLGIVLQDLGEIDQAIETYRKAVRLDPHFAEGLNNLGTALQARGFVDHAIASFSEALKVKPEYAEALNNLGNGYREQGSQQAAMVCYQKALRLKADYADAYNNMGNLYQESGQVQQAIDCYRKALEFGKSHADAHNNLGSVLQETGDLDATIASFKEALRLNPAYAGARAQMLHQKQHICDWTVQEEIAEVIEVLGVEGPSIAPFCALAMEDHPERQMLRSRNWAREKYRQTPMPLAARPRERPNRLKIGYFSADFHSHATMHLLGGLLREHDKDRFEVHAFSYGRPAEDEARRTLMENVSGFADVRGLSDREVVDLARGGEGDGRGLDIAIDLKGFTRQTRSQLFAHRLAPIQVNYLGYPGTLAADFSDYLIADHTVIPEAQRRFYSEKIVYLPGSYQPNDNLRQIADCSLSRQDFGLPEEGFVFCCFNQSYKISPREFDIWMRLLQAAEGSVLWLLRSNRWAEANLRKEAEARGVSPERLVFADAVDHSLHLARNQFADLFLDTFAVNAHTTASDALWAGLPVITRAGDQFAARVAASLLKAVGLDDLVCETDADYEALALNLARDPNHLREIRKGLNGRLKNTPLFDTARYARNFEKGLDGMFARYLKGEAPADLEVDDA